jgi:predicted N-acetyltransferase YhbS
MKTTMQFYDHDTDYEAVSQFLVRTSGDSGQHVNWLQPRWEYMHRCGGIRNVNLNAIGIWEVDGKIVGVIHPEHQMGTVYVEIDPAYTDLKREMLGYAEQHLCGTTDNGRQLGVFINDRDLGFQQVAVEMGYTRAEHSEAMSQFSIPRSFPRISLPDGFSFKGLDEDHDPEEVAMGIWRGFDHTDDPPDNNMKWWHFMREAPNYRPELHIRVVTPGGSLASYCGMWHEPVKHVAYVEPVCTVPEFRRMGLGRAAVCEGIRRCGEAGATVAYVGTAWSFYDSVGFTQIFNRSLWRKEWKAEPEAAQLQT